MADRILEPWPLRVAVTVTHVVAAIVLAGCGDAPALEVDAPLFVMNTYPANGASVAHDDLGQLAVTFSADLGPADDVRAQVPTFISLTFEGTSMELMRPNLLNVAYDEAMYTLRVEIPHAQREGFPGGLYEFSVRAGLAAADGRALPVDHVVQFRLVPPEQE